MIYVLKITLFLLFLISLYLSEKIFADLYMRKVYGENTDPPNILIFLGIVLGVNAAFTVFVITLLLLLLYLFNDSDNTFKINPFLIKNFLIDLFFILILFTLISIIVGNTFQNKKYFRYKHEGLRCLKAYKNLMIQYSSLIYSLPYYLLFI